MPQLGPALDERWHQGEDVAHPTSGKPMKMYTLALKAVKEENVVVLEGETLATEKDLSALGFNFVHLNDSDLSTGGWPIVEGYWSGRHDGSSVFDMVSKVYPSLLAIIYGFPVALGVNFDRELRWDPENGRSSLNSILGQLTALCTHAEYHDSLARFAPAFTTMLADHPSFWEDVAAEPGPWLRLAKKLRNEDIFFDAARCLIASRDYDGIAEELDMPVDVAMAKFVPLLKRLDLKVDNLQAALLRLQLTPITLRDYGQSHTGWTLFLHAIKHKLSSRNAYVKANERFDWVARKIFGEWLVYHVVDAHRLFVGGFGKVKNRPSNPLEWACDRLVKAAWWETPADLLGARAPERYVAIFDLEPKRFDPVKRLRNKLNSLVREAAEIIETTFPVKEQELEDGTVLTFRRAMYDAGPYGFTYMPLDETKLPWEGEPEWVDGGEVGEVDMTPASRMVVRGYGIADRAESETGKEAGSADECAAAKRQVWGGELEEGEVQPVADGSDGSKGE